MNRVDIKFRDGQPLTFHNPKSCTFDNGWVHVTDEYENTHSFPADTVMHVEQTPTRRW
jgi:hypothetical protein